MAIRTAHRSNPGADIDALIAVVNQLAALANELKADYNALLTKLDADAGVTDTNYNALRAVAAADADTITLAY